jgi:uncharacterized protein YidB (DUF937 family)
MFEALIREAAGKYDLGGNAQRFVGLLLNLIFNPATGGFNGFMKKFQDAGLGGLFSTWVGGTPGDNVLQPDQVASALDGNSLGGIAGKLGVPPALVNIAIAGILPKLVGLLTPGGRIPTAVPAEASGLLAGLDQARPVAPSPPVAPARSGPGWLKWVIPLLVVLALGYCMLDRKPAAVDTAPVATTPAPAASAPVAQADPRFTLETGGGKATVGGQLASDADRARLMDALNATFGAGNVSGDIAVDAATLPAGWIDRLIAVIPELKADGLKLGFDGDRLTLDTSGLGEDQRFAVSERLRAAFGGFEISGLWDRAAAALASLRPGYGADDLVQALNLMRVYFDTGSATITRDSQEILGKAAEAIRAAPADTRIEVGGHTDNTGDAAANMALSRQRADAVVARLAELGVAPGVLTARGYGQEKPIADNATEDGRASNRRIEFSVTR